MDERHEIVKEIIGLITKRAKETELSSDDIKMILQDLTASYFLYLGENELELFNHNDAIVFLHKNYKAEKAKL